MSGFEVAGLVLAILPLVIEGVKVYGSGVETTKSLLSNKKRDSELQTTYRDIQFELFWLKRRLGNLVERLPRLCKHCKDQLKTGTSFVFWEANTSVRDALLAHFGDQNDLDEFLDVMSTILSFVDQLINTEGLKLDDACQDPVKLRSRIASFISLRQTNTITGTFGDRFRFLREQKERSKCVAALKNWNQNLERMLRLVEPEQPTQTVANPTPAITASRSSWIEEGRRAFHALIDAARGNWDCSCNMEHEAMLCLDIRPLSEHKSKRMFDFLVKGHSTQLWFEGRFVLQMNHHDASLEVWDFLSLCDSIDEDATEMLQLLVEVDRAQQTSVKQLRPRQTRFSWLNKGIPRNLQQSLINGELKLLKDKRMIALSFAYAVLQFHGSQCLSDTIQREVIFFYALTENMVDFSRPFLKTRFQRLPQLTTTVNRRVQHRNAAIMNLGILLLELDKGKLFSEMRNDKLQNPTPNQDLKAAKTLIDEIESPEYRSAVRACLEVGWVTAGVKVDLGNNDVCDAFIRAVIEPLKEDVEWMLNY